jgi:subtilisin family serine protease
MAVIGKRGVVVVGILFFFLLLFGAVLSFGANSSDSPKLHPSLKHLTSAQKVLVQVNPLSNERVKHLLDLNKIKFTIDPSLLSIEVEASDLDTLVQDLDVLNIWPDLETQSFVFNGMHQVNVDSFWNLDYHGAGVKIAILDSGIATHEAFGSRIVESVDFTGTGTSDIFSHGTHVAGIAAGSIGMANETTIYNVKVLDDNGYGQLSWLINGIDWAIANNVDVISLSLGAIYSGSASEQLSSPEVLKVEEAIANGIIVVIASGNCGSGRCGSFNCVTTPGIARNAITVGAVDSNSNWASFSSGCVISDYIKPDLVAPGVSIYSSVPNGYDYKTGTSMATPFVSGAAVMMIEHQDYTPAEIKSMLEANAVDLGVTGKDVQYGSGLMNLDGIFDTNVSTANSYNLIIPAFEVGSKDKIKVEYTNNNGDNLNVRVEFWIEELDSIFTDSSEKNMPAGKTKEFSFSFEPRLLGRHVLRIKIYEDSVLINEIKSSVSVTDSIFKDKFEGVMIK